MDLEFADDRDFLSPLKLFQKASVLDMEQYKFDLKKYKSQLTPVQLQQLVTEKRMKLKKRKATRKKRVRGELF